MSFVAIIAYCVLVQFYTRIYLEEGQMWRENGLLNIVIVKLVASAVVCVSLPGATPPSGEGGGT